MSIFGRGGGVDPDLPPSNITEPSPLDFGGDGSEIIEKINNPRPSRPVGPSNNYGTGGFGGSLGGGYRPGGSGGMYGSGSGGLERPRVDSPKEFQDMATTDKLEDEEIRQLRKAGYRLSNIEKEYDIIHKNHFSKIVKVVMIAFAVLLFFCVITVIGVVAYTSITSGTMSETGIINGILQFISDLMRTGLS